MKSKRRTFALGFFFALIIYCKDGLSQVQLETTDSMTTYLDVSHKWDLNEQRGEKLVGFLLKNLDTLGVVNWKSNIITTFEKYNENSKPWSYFIKVTLPKHVLINSKELWCKALVINPNINQTDTIEINYGGVRLSKITLELISEPKGAEAYIIPNRIWKDKIERSNWKTNDTLLEEFSVNTDRTDVKVSIDETVYVVLFRLNNVFKKRIHYTKPAAIEQQQKVSINF